MNLDESSAEEDCRRRMLVKLKNSRVHASVCDETEYANLNSIVTTRSICDNEGKSNSRSKPKSINVESFDKTFLF